MKSDSFYLTQSNYNEKAKGWVDGTYYPRTEIIKELDKSSLLKEDGYYVIDSLVWTETEETGHGVYQYEDTKTFNYKLDNLNYKVNLTFANPTKEPYKANVKVNGITKLSELIVEPQSETEATFTATIVNGLLSIKILPEYTATSYEEADYKNIYIKDIDIQKLKLKKPGNKPVLFLASDSTVQTYNSSTAPQTGWGQVLIDNFKNSENHTSPRPKVYETDDIIIENHAIGGRSAKSFIMEGRFDEILENIKENDYVFVQFGHNDATKVRPNRYVSSEDFDEYIQYFIDGVKQRKGICVLVTPVARRNYNEEVGKFRISFNNYRQVMLGLSKDQDIPLLDLGKESTAYLNTIGPEDSKEIFLWVEKGKYPDSNHAEGVSDDTHLQYKGACIFSEILAKLILEYNQDELLDPLKEIIDVKQTI